VSRGFDVVEMLIEHARDLACGWYQVRRCGNHPRKCAVLVNPFGYALERPLLPGRPARRVLPRLGCQRTVVSRETVVTGRQTVGRDR
jgi:hypothetical protein